MSACVKLNEPLYQSAEANCAVIRHFYCISKGVDFDTIAIQPLEPDNSTHYWGDQIALTLGDESFELIVGEIYEPANDGRHAIENSKDLYCLLTGRGDSQCDSKVADLFLKRHLELPGTRSSNSEDGFADEVFVFEVARSDGWTVDINRVIELCVLTSRGQLICGPDLPVCVVTRDGTCAD
jgi:hypothetical protein